MLTAAQWSLSLVELGPDYSCGISVEADLPYSEPSQLSATTQMREHVAKGACTFNAGPKIIFNAEGPIISKKGPE